MTRLTPTTLTLFILILATCGMAFLLALIPAAGHDQLWFLLMAQRILHGAAPYGPEAFDSNPPAILWLSTLPVFLAEHLHLSPAFTAKLLSLLLILAIALLLSWIQRTTARSSFPAANSVTTPSNGQTRLFLLFTFLLLTCVIPARDFGQRDHLTALLLLPYLLTAFDPPTHRTLSPLAAFALLAGLGVCLKPQQALVPLVIELALLLRTRRLASATSRPAPWIFLTTGALYLAAIHRFAPLYFSSALPTTLATYWAIGHLTPFQLFREALQLHLLALVTLTLALRRRPTPPQTLALLLAGLAATAAYYLQGTGWYYQQLPALTFFGLALALQLAYQPVGFDPKGAPGSGSLIADPGVPQHCPSPGAPGSGSLIADPGVADSVSPGRPIPIPRWLPLATALLSFLTLGLTFHFSGFPFTRQAFSDPYTNPIQTPSPTFFDHLPPGTPIATLTTSVDEAIMPVLRYHLTWAQRTNNLWTLPALLRSRQIAPGSGGLIADPGVPPSNLKGHLLTPSRLTALEAQQRRWMVEDLLRWHPTLILIARCQAPEVHCQTLEDRHDDLLAFFQRDPAFAAIFSHYHLTATTGPYDAYTLTPTQ